MQLDLQIPWMTIMPENLRVAEPGFIYRSGKTYSHSVGLSVAFRQWRAKDSHCRFIHGYALQVELCFQSKTLDEKNWVQDFGGLKEIKQWLQDTFDHKLVVASDDPQISIFREMQIAKMCELSELSHVGCEAFARIIHGHVQGYLNARQSRVTLAEVIVREHEANWASYGLEHMPSTYVPMSEMRFA